MPTRRVRACVAGYTKLSRLARTSLKSMKNKTDPADSSLSETMVARIEINELGDPAHQKKITDAVEALDGVIETKIQKGALHVSYDPMVTSEKKIEQAIRSTGTNIKAAATDTERAHPDLPTPANAEQAPVENARHDEHS
jgi:copper chaperone CopZ